MMLIIIIIIITGASEIELWKSFIFFSNLSGTQQRKKGSRMQSTEQLRPEQLVGLVARSAEGTAAKGMPIKGHEDLWVEIQANTFRNWVNEHLKQAGDMGGGPVVDLAEDFRDGTRLCALVEVLTQRRLPRWNPRPANQHHHLENVSTALQAIEADGVKLVNIGNEIIYIIRFFFFFFFFILTII